jgi:putative NADH-flavin reductase
MKNLKKVLVIGASGGSGRKTVEALKNAGHEVTALSRSASKIFQKDIKTIDGSCLNKNTLIEAVKDQDAVIIILGISENPFRVRFLGPKSTPIDIRSRGTEMVIETMKELGVKRLVVQTTYGSGPSKDKLKIVDRLFFELLLKPQIMDTEKQDRIVRNSALDWTITQPVHLIDKEDSGGVFTSEILQVREWKISRKLVGISNAHFVQDDSSIGKTIALSTNSAN